MTAPPKVVAPVIARVCVGAVSVLVKPTLLPASVVFAPSVTAPV
jgi:hypothetical protein